MDDTDRALKFGLFLDSLCAGVSAMPQDAARAVAVPVEPSFTVSTASPLPSLSQGGGGQ